MGVCVIQRVNAYTKCKPVIACGALILFGSIRTTIITFCLLVSSHSGRLHFRKSPIMDCTLEEISTDKNARGKNTHAQSFRPSVLNVSLLHVIVSKTIPSGTPRVIGRNLNRTNDPTNGMCHTTRGKSVNARVGAGRRDICVAIEPSTQTGTYTGESRKKAFRTGLL